MTKSHEEAINKVVGILKKRFNNLSAEELIHLAIDIVGAVVEEVVKER